MGHSYIDVNLYKQHVKDYVENQIKDFNKYVSKTVVVDLATPAYKKLMEISFHQGTKISTIGEVIKKELILEQM